MSAVRKSVPRDTGPAGPSAPLGPNSKTMVLINNGDKLSRGRPYILDTARVTSWPVALQDMTDFLRPAYGSVKRVFTPRGGTELGEVKRLDQNGVYVVAGGAEQFKPIPNGYNTDTIINQHFTHVPKTSIAVAKPVKEIPVYYSGTDMPDLKRASMQILTISVFRNGDDVNAPTKVMLKKFDLWNILRAKDAISEKVKPMGGFCKSLRTLDGNPVKHIADLKNNAYYVAVGPYEKFRQVDYCPEGRPNIVVPMKLRSSFTAQTYQDPEGQKRRRTFVVRLKKNDPTGEVVAGDEGDVDADQPETGGHRKASRQSSRGPSRQGSRHGSRHSQKRSESRARQIADKNYYNDDEDDGPIKYIGTQPSHHSFALDLPNSLLDVSVRGAEVEPIVDGALHANEETQHAQEEKNQGQDDGKDKVQEHDHGDDHPPSLPDQPSGEGHPQPEHHDEPPAPQEEPHQEPPPPPPPSQETKHDEPAPEPGHGEGQPQPADDQQPPPPPSVEEPPQPPVDQPPAQGQDQQQDGGPVDGEKHGEEGEAPPQATVPDTGVECPPPTEPECIPQTVCVTPEGQEGEHCVPTVVCVPVEGPGNDPNAPAVAAENVAGEGGQANGDVPRPLEAIPEEAHEPKEDGEKAPADPPAHVSQKFDLTEHEEVLPTPKKKKGGCC